MVTRRALLMLMILGLMAAACGDKAGPGASPTELPTATSSPSPTPGELEGASCEPTSGGGDENVPDFVEVIPSHEDGIDRVTFRFEPTDPSISTAPSFTVQYVDQLTTDGEGVQVDVEGNAFVAISFHAIGVKLTGETPEKVYKGPTEFKTGFANLLEIEELGDFEAIVSWGMGLQRRACFRVASSPTEITVEFPSP